MPSLRKKPRSGRAGSNDVNRYLRLFRPRDGAVREVDKAKAPAKAKATRRSRAAAPPGPAVPFNGERQAVVCLYLNLLTSEHSEADIAVEFWRCYKHLLEGGTAETMPVRLVDQQTYLTELARVKARRAYLLDDNEGETHDDDRSHHREDR